MIELNANVFPPLVRRKIFNYLCLYKSRDLVYLHQLKKRLNHFDNSVWGTKRTKYNRRRLDDPDVYFPGASYRQRMLYGSNCGYTQMVHGDSIITKSNGYATNPMTLLPDRYFYSCPELNPKFCFSKNPQG